MGSVKKKVHQEFPPGWDAEKVRALAEYYDNQSDEEALAEDEAALESEGQTLVMVPNELMPTIRALLAKHQQEDEIDIREVKKALADVEKNGTIPWEEVKKDLGL